MKLRIILNISIFCLMFFLNIHIFGKNIIENYEPRYWWTEMKHSNIIIAAKGNNLNKSIFKINYPGITFNQIIYTNNPEIVFLDIDINENVITGIVPIQIFQSGRFQQAIYFELKSRIPESSKLTNSLTKDDVIYQIIVDRFRNGNYSNDKVSEYLEGPNRQNPSAIHGGDINGITKSLDYIKSVGASCIEISPLYESNQIANSYYHDEITSHYQLDKRLGTFADLKNLSNQCKQKNIKYIQTIVLHQTSNKHWLFGSESVTGWTYAPSDRINNQIKILPESDPYSCNKDFIDQYYNKNTGLSLINQNIPIVKKFLIQNSIWWIEQLSPSALKIENTHYNSTSFLQALINDVRDEYPSISLISDINTSQNDELAYLSETYFNTHPGLNYDYPLSKALADGFSEFVSKEQSIINLHHTLAKDFNYIDPYNQIVFIDNNSTSRAFTLADKNIDQLKMMYTYWATSRGIPSLLYGSELLMEGNHRRGYGHARVDFPGGWINDKQNAFTGKSLSSEQLSFKQFLTELLSWRSSSYTIKNGKTMHYLISEDLYAVLRYDENKYIMILYNNSERLQKVNITNCTNELGEFTMGKDPIYGSIYNDLRNVIIEPKTAFIIELK
ncbi:hypothetical protein E9993_11210 [Labilibacter sediminis]|nr:hypothetical protein E9993_11210 [Labilibacter sediminis]